MIKSKSRKGWFGASDTSYIVGNWETDTFRRWWLTKLGLAENTVESKFMKAGTEYEHQILTYCGITKMDRQIRIRRLRLRVNLDGEDRRTVCEVKTHKTEVYKLSKVHWRQAQVEMFASRKKCKIVAYHMKDENYINYFLPIIQGRLSFHPVKYDPDWIVGEWLPKLMYLTRCMKKGVMPDAREFALFNERLQKSKVYRFNLFIFRLRGRI